MLAPHIGIFGRRNYGKSSLVNFLVGQNIAIVSDTPGTTTDPVRKSMEISGIGPVVWIDTAGIDDDSNVGRQRIEKSLQALSMVDFAIILFTNNTFAAEEITLIENCKNRHIPFLLVYSMADKLPPNPGLLSALAADYHEPFVLSVKRPELRQQLVLRIREVLPDSAYRHNGLLSAVINPSDTVVLVVPVDSSAPEGRLILPQVQVLRDILDNHAKAFVCRETELEQTLAQLPQPPALVITDSQVFPMVADVVPESVPLTSFSVILACSKGPFFQYLCGTPAIDTLADGDSVLLLESCTHNVTCEDIGRVKLPAMLQNYTKKHLVCEVVAALDALPRPITSYKLVIQCGGCVATPKQIESRVFPAIQAGIPITNYGLAIAFMSGIFERATAIFTN